MAKPFLSDVQKLRARAREHIEQGAVTAGYRADRETVMTPSGDLYAIASVARRYDTRLILVHPMLGRQTTMALLANLEGASGPIRLTTIARHGACRLARLDVLGDPRP